MNLIFSANSTRFGGSSFLALPGKGKVENNDSRVPWTYFAGKCFQGSHVFLCANNGFHWKMFAAPGWKHYFRFVFLSEFRCSSIQTSFGWIHSFPLNLFLDETGCFTSMHISEKTLKYADVRNAIFRTLKSVAHNKGWWRFQGNNHFNNLALQIIASNQEVCNRSNRWNTKEIWK